MALRRGFKAEAERIAAELRAQLGVEEADAVDIRDVAALLEVSVVPADSLVEIGRLEEIERIQAFAFSACTFIIGDARYIVVNPLRTPARQVSDIAHELAHELLHHELSEIREIDGVPFRTCATAQEEEATHLGGTILLPRPLLLAEARLNAKPDDIADKYGVTPEMASFRFNTTGVERQVAAARSRRRQG